MRYVICISNHLTPNSAHIYYAGKYMYKFECACCVALSYLQPFHSSKNVYFAHSGRYALNIQNYFKSTYTHIHNKTTGLDLAFTTCVLYIYTLDAYFITQRLELR